MMTFFRSFYLKRFKNHKNFKEIDRKARILQFLYWIQKRKKNRVPRNLLHRVLKHRHIENLYLFLRNIMIKSFKMRNQNRTRYCQIAPRWRSWSSGPQWGSSPSPRPRIWWRHHKVCPSVSPRKLFHRQRRFLCISV